MQAKIKEGRDGHNADAAHLNQEDQDHLPKKAQILTRVPHSKSRYAGGRGGCKKGIQGITPLPIAVGNGQAQKKGA